MRKSKINNDDCCFFCGGRKEAEHHLIFGYSRRTLADADGIYVPICNNCHTTGTLQSRIHDNSMAERLSKMLGQAIWELEAVKKDKSCDARKKFMERYGINYL